MHSQEQQAHVEAEDRSARAPAAIGTKPDSKERDDLIARLRIDAGDRPGPGRRRSVAIIAATLAIAAAIGGYALRFRQIPEVQAAVVEPLETGAPMVMQSSLDGSGYVVARRQATVSSKSTGRVVAMLIEEGQHVSEGEVIAVLDDASARAAVSQAAAQLDHARASLNAASAAWEDGLPIFERAKLQYEGGYVSAQSFDQARRDNRAARTAVEVADAAVRVAEANLLLVEKDLEDTIVRAPFAGVVTVKAAQEGETVSPVSAGGGFTRTGIGTIVDMSSLEVEVDVNESFINRVRPGQRVDVRLNAYPDWQIGARVVAIVPTADRAKAAVRVRIGFDAIDERVLPQMGVRVSFLESDDNSGEGSLAPLPAGVLIPTHAVETDGDRGIVYLIRDDHVERRAVSLGADTPDGRIVQAGLSPGMHLAIAADGVLRDGMRVRVRQTEGEF